MSYQCHGEGRISNQASILVYMFMNNMMLCFYEIWKGEVIVHIIRTLAERKKTSRINQCLNIVRQLKFPVSLFRRGSRQVMELITIVVLGLYMLKDYSFRSHYKSIMESGELGLCQGMV